MVLKVSKRMLQQAARMEALRKEQDAVGTSEVSVTQSSSGESKQAPHLEGAATPEAADPAEQRAKSGGVRKALGAMQGGLIGQLEETRAELDDVRRDLESREAELSTLRPLAGAEVVLRIDPSQVRPTRWSNRLERSFSVDDPAFKALLDDVTRKGGNKVAAVVRRLKEPEDGFEFECVTGHRRLEASRLAGTLFYTHVAPADWSDEEAMALQITENSFRRKRSAVEQGLKIESMLRAWRDDSGRVGYGQLDALADQLKFADKAYLNKLSKIGRLPSVVFEAVSDPRLIPFKAAYDLAVAWEAGPAEVESRISTVPRGVSPKEQAVYLAGGNARLKGPSAALTIRPPRDAGVREKFLTELRDLLGRYGLDGQT